MDHPRFWAVLSPRCASNSSLSACQIRVRWISKSSFKNPSGLNLPSRRRRGCHLIGTHPLDDNPSLHLQLHRPQVYRLALLAFRNLRHYYSAGLRRNLWNRACFLVRRDRIRLKGARDDLDLVLSGRDIRNAKISVTRAHRAKTSLIAAGVEEVLARLNEGFA